MSQNTFSEAGFNKTAQLSAQPGRSPQNLAFKNTEKRIKTNQSDVVKIKETDRVNIML